MLPYEVLHYNARTNCVTIQMAKLIQRLCSLVECPGFKPEFFTISFDHLMFDCRASVIDNLLFEIIQTIIKALAIIKGNIGLDHSFLGYFYVSVLN